MLKFIDKLQYDFIDKSKFKNLNIKSFNDLEGIIDQDYLEFLVFEYIKQNPNTFVLNVWPVCQNGDGLIRKHYSKFCKFIYYKEIKLHPDGYFPFLKHLSDKSSHSNGVNLWFAKPYSDNTPVKIFIIETIPQRVTKSVSFMKKYLIEIFNNNSTYINKIHNKGLNALKNLYITTKCKRECRKMLSSTGRVMKVLKEKPPYNYSHHINDEHSETIEVSKMILNRNTIQLLQYFKWNKLKGFDKKLNNFIKHLLKQKVDLNNILIYNSGILGPLGLREPKDIDFFQLDKKLLLQNRLPKDIDIQNKYFPRGYMILQIKNKKPQYMEDNPNYGKNIDIKDMEYTLSLKDIVFNPKNYFYYQGIKFMWIDIFKKVKKIRGRPKDLEQMKLLQENIKL